MRVSSASARIGGDEALPRRTSYQWIMHRSGIPLFHRDCIRDLLLRYPVSRERPLAYVNTVCMIMIVVCLCFSHRPVDPPAVAVA